MFRIALLAFALTSGVAAPAAAQQQSSAVASIDPAKLSKARRIVQSFFPESSREQMVGAMMDTVTRNMRDGLAQNGDIQALMSGNTAAGEVFARFLDRQSAIAKQDMYDTLPKLLDAMAAAYARRFSTTQLDELAAFFETPTGRTYVRESMTILSDPDIARVQSEMMARSLERLPQALAGLVEELRSAPKPIPGT